MTKLKCLKEHKHNNKLAAAPVSSDKRSVIKEDDRIDLFPLPRYFQVHFGHIHDNTFEIQGKLNHLNHDLQSQMDQLKETLAKVEGKLDRFIDLLEYHTESEH